MCWHEDITNNTAQDSVGQNDGSLQGAATYGPGLYGSAFVLDGVNSSIHIPASASLNVGASMTWADRPRGPADRVYGHLMEKMGLT